MTDPVDHCAFCGNTDLSRLTWEHLWPRWSHKEIIRSMRKWNGAHTVQRIEVDKITTSEPRTTKNAGDVHDFQVRCVCGGDRRSCNAGWMKDIEDCAKPIMTPLMNGASLRLMPDQQNIVATWAVLKAIVAEYTKLGTVTTTQAERDLLRLTGLPPHRGWGVWIGYFERAEWPGYLGSTRFLYRPGPENRRLLSISTPDFNGQASFQVVKKLFVQVIGCGVPEFVEKWRFDSAASNVLRKIWPPSDISIRWPPPVMSDMDADYVASAVKNAATTGIQRRLESENRGHTWSSDPRPFVNL